MENVLILGVGNLLMRDEGFGVRAVELLEKTTSGRKTCACWKAVPWA